MVLTTLQPQIVSLSPLQSYADSFGLFGTNLQVFLFLLSLAMHYILQYVKITKKKKKKKKRNINAFKTTQYFTGDTNNYRFMETCLILPLITCQPNGIVNRKSIDGGQLSPG